jgi:hypothetical protein
MGSCRSFQDAGRSEVAWVLIGPAARWFMNVPRDTTPRRSPNDLQSLVHPCKSQRMVQTRIISDVAITTGRNGVERARGSISGWTGGPKPSGWALRRG